jgi:hypothetical protein
MFSSSINEKDLHGVIKVLVGNGLVAQSLELVRGRHGGMEVSGWWGTTMGRGVVMR